ncbi:MAG: hypothetical protein AB7G37_21050, partial [Solirubrobacteraceae bacterium]
VLVIAERGARAGRWRLRRKARFVDPAGAPEDVVLQLASYVEATAPVGDIGVARSRLTQIAESDEQQAHWVQEGLSLINRAIRAHRAGSRDPYVVEVARRDARHVRIGYGTTDEVRDGRFTEAVDVPPPPGTRAPRSTMLAPSEAVADALTGRLDVLECEDLLLRAYLDLDHGRTRAAAHQVGAALALVVAETAPEGDAAQRLADARATVGELLTAVASRGLDEDEVDALVGAIDAGVRVLERRRSDREALSPDR